MEWRTLSGLPRFSGSTRRSRLAGTYVFPAAGSVLDRPLPVAPADAALHLATPHTSAWYFEAEARSTSPW